MNILAYVVMKTERAHDHLNALNRELNLFLKEAYAVTTKEDIDNARYVRRTHFKGMDPVIGMLLGEFLYCLRSGLDQMAWQLALPSARSDPRQRTNICFPIFETASTSEQRRNLTKILNLFPSEVAAEIDALQPYKGPGVAQDHPLWQLNKLCNIDKHCIIPFNSRTKDIFIPHNAAVLVTNLDTEDAVEVSVPLADKAQFDFDPNTPGDIVLGEWDTDLIIPRRRLADIHGFFTCTVIPKFARFDGPIITIAEVRTGEFRPIH